MTPRLICPHCHAPVDSGALDTGHCAVADLWICPLCDTPILMARRTDPLVPNSAALALPLADAVAA